MYGGYISGNGHYYPGSRGFYWSSSFKTDVTFYAWCGMYFEPEGVLKTATANCRYYGQSIRPVKE